MDFPIGLQHLLKYFRVYGAAERNTSLWLALIKWLQLLLYERRPFAQVILTLGQLVASRIRNYHFDFCVG